MKCDGFVLMNNKERGKNLKRLREDKGLSQKELADKLNYTRQNLSKWENGIAFPTDEETIDKLASILEISKKELLNPEDQNDTKEISKKSKTNIIILVIITIIVIALSITLYFIFKQKIYMINIDGLFSGVYTKNHKERYLNLYTEQDIENYDRIYLYTVHDNKEMYILKTTDKSIRVYENNSSNEYNLRYALKCGLHLVVFYKDDTYKTYDYYLDENKYNSTCDYTFSYKKESFLESVGFIRDGLDYTYMINGNKVSYDWSNYRVYMYKNGISETLETLSNSMYMYEKYNDKNENLGEKIIKITGYKNCNEETSTTYEDYAKFINFLADNKE